MATITSRDRFARLREQIGDLSDQLGVQVHSISVGDEVSQDGEEDLRRFGGQRKGAVRAVAVSRAARRPLPLARHRNRQRMHAGLRFAVPESRWLRPPDYGDDPHAGGPANGDSVVQNRAAAERAVRAGRVGAWPHQYPRRRALRRRHGSAAAFAGRCLPAYWRGCSPPWRCRPCRRKAPAAEPPPALSIPATPQSIRPPPPPPRWPALCPSPFRGQRLQCLRVPRRAPRRGAS